MHEERTARRTTGTDSISCKYKINIVFVAGLADITMLIESNCQFFCDYIM